LSRIVLCRHGETEHNAAGLFLSSDDPPLNERGRKQCEALREALKEFRFERCFSSPMRRCLETREIVAPDVPFEVDDALREVHFGLWEGKGLEWLERFASDLLAARRRDPVAFRPPGGESFEDIAPRLQSLAEALRECDAAVVIGHRGSLGVLERLLRGLPLRSQVVERLEPAEFHVVELV
jgi:alpha-ribazole phosphatase